MLYIRHTDKSQSIIHATAIEDNGEYIRVFTDYGCRCVMKFEMTFPEVYGSGNYMPGIESYQLDGYPVVWVKQNDTKESN